MTVEDLALAIMRQCLSLQNRHISDIDRLFYDNLWINMSIKDCNARILNYFVLFDKIIENYGLQGIFESGIADETT